MSTPSLHLRSSRKGFALLITVTLLAFLVLLLVSLATLTRVETQVAANNQQLTGARQNALMALTTAIGQLQKYTGPDQRITARSDLDASLTHTQTKSGHWTGAYGRAVASADMTTRDLYSDVASKITTDLAANSDANGNQAQLLTWLVSGNENTAFDPAKAVDVNGQIVRDAAPKSFAFTPSDAVSGLGADSTAFSTNLTIAGTGGSKPARLLVGPNSTTAVEDYVAVPVIDISVDASTVPGLAAGSTATIGRYAWWVGDENAKARINLPLATATEAPQAFISSQRAAIELMDGTHPAGSTTIDTATTDSIGSAYDPAANGLTRLMAADQMPLLTPASSGVLSTAIKYRFHDLTAYSTSVLSDTYAGGLRKDLSALLASDYIPPSAGTVPAVTDFLFPPEPTTGNNKTNEYGMPTWGVLRSFVQTTVPAGGGLTPRPPEMASVSGHPVPVPTSVGIAPVMTYVTFGFQYVAPSGDHKGGPINLAIFPVVVLWNPYTTDIVPFRYEVGLRRTDSGLVELQGRPGPPKDEDGNLMPDDPNYPWSAENVMEVANLNWRTNTDVFLRFGIDSPGIPAGQSLVFTLPTSEKPYVPSDPQNMLTSKTYKPLAHVLFPSSLTIGTQIGSKTPTNTGGIYRVGVNGVANPSSDLHTPKSLFSNNSVNMWGGNASHEGYLGTYAAPVVTQPRPYTTSGNHYTSQQWYQSVHVMNRAPYVNASPYSTGATGGYAVASVSTGLIQDAGPLTVATQPTFRIQIRGLFWDGVSARWIAQSNPRGFTAVGMPIGGNGASPFFTGQTKEVNWPPDLNVFNIPEAIRASSGTSLNDPTTENPVDTTLFEYRPDSLSLMAVGQLQHANLAWNNIYPAYAIGNSAAPAGVDSKGFSQHPDQLVLFSGGGGNNPTDVNTAYYDLSWLLNQSIWDRYFVSTIPYAGTGKSGDTTNSTIPTVLPNTRHVRYGAPGESQLRDADRAAAHLLVTGGFNINSTSEQAWRAVLGGMNNLSFDPTGTGSGASTGAALSRFSKPTTNSDDNAWQGYRQLTPEQIAQLAANIVTEIRLRGPFVSMGDFINRRLIAKGTFPQADDPRFKGALQAAIDLTPLGATAINRGDLAPYNHPFFSSNVDIFSAGGALNGTSPVPPYGSASAFSPQFVTQADVLSAIGSGLSARSDTFTIRTYGETVNPVLSPTDSNYVTGRAWCEAVVQRLPDYVDAIADADAHSPATALINKTLGRRFKIISFRWLSSNDI